MMNNYAETKKELDRIRNKYDCKGEVLFRSAIQCVLDYGMSNLLDDECYAHGIDEINERHDAAKAESRMLWVTRDFELAIIECAREIAKVEVYDLLVYIQKEVWLSNEGGMDYKRAIELLKSCMEWFTDDTLPERVLENLNLLGFTNDEIAEFGFNYLFDDEERKMKIQKAMINGTAVYQVTKEVIDQVLENQTGIEHYGEPHHLLWYYDEKSGKYIGCDNVHAHAWMEEFDTKEECINWLLGEGENEDE